MEGNATNLSLVNDVAPPKTGLGSFTLEFVDLGSPLDVFRDVKETAAITECTNAKYYPITPLTDETRAIEFMVNPNMDAFIDMSRCSLSGDLKVVKRADADGKEIDLTADDDVSCTNLLPSSLFSQLSLYLKGTPVNDSSSFLYAMKSVLETNFSFNQDCKENMLKAQCLYLDDVPGSETTTDKTKTDSGYHLRKPFIALSRTARFIVPLHTDFNQTSR